MRMSDRIRPSALFPGERVGPGLFWSGTENFFLQGFDPWTLQSVANRYTYNAIMAHII